MNEANSFRFSDYLAKLDPNIDKDLLDELAFYGSVSDDDDATATIRGLARLEAMLLELIKRNLEKPGLIEPEYFSFGQRLRWAEALGEIGPKTSRALRCLAKIRNHLAHCHLHIVAPDNLTLRFITAIRDLPRHHAIDAVLNDERYKERITPLRWQMRMGITILHQTLFELIILPPKRIPSRPGAGVARRASS